MLTDGDKLASFITLAERDCIDAPEYTPWIGFVHTAPEYRGRRCAGRLIEHACVTASSNAASRVYICTDHIGLYEKYGFTYLENRMSIYGEDSRIYVREPITVKSLTHENFHVDSLDNFIRRQEVDECWRCVNSEWQLVSNPFTEEWDAAHLRAEAADLQRTIDEGIPAIGAFDGERIIGFAQLGECLGSRNQYIELTGLHVSEPWRGRGIGRRLFAAVCDAARSRGMDKLYISAHSSKESQAAYRALGCVYAEEVDPIRAAKEPCDVQMEYDLKVDVHE